MDELELLKKDWKKQGDSFQKLSYNEIYKMIHKKSSSIVKWIFIICIAELLFWGFANLLIPEIIKTRKTVNYYVYYNIIITAILSIVVYTIMFSDEALLNEVMNPNNKIIDNPDIFFNTILITIIVTSFIMIGLLWLYYKLIYGILLRKLNKNYKELETLEV